MDDSGRLFVIALQGQDHSAEPFTEGYLDLLSSYLGALSPYVGKEELGFGLGCLVLASVVVLVHFVLLVFYSRPMLGGVYNAERPWLAALLWPVGAGLVGLLGSVVDIIQVNPLGAIAVCFSWPLLARELARLGRDGRSRSREDEFMKELGDI